MNKKKRKIFFRKKINLKKKVFKLLYICVIIIKFLVVISCLLMKEISVNG